MQLVKVSADLGRIPTNRIPQSKGADGKMYYKIHLRHPSDVLFSLYHLRIMHNGTNYGLVTSEYV